MCASALQQVTLFIGMSYFMATHSLPHNTGSVFKPRIVTVQEHNGYRYMIIIKQRATAEIVQHEHPEAQLLGCSFRLTFEGKPPGKPALLPVLLFAAFCHNSGRSMICV